MALRVEDLAGLELFVAALRLGSISAAAREQHVSQAAASERLRNLERRLGLKVLRRGPSGSAPTPEGEAIAVWADEVLEAIGQMAAGLDAIRERSAPLPLRIMASMTIAEYVMPSWLRARQDAGDAPVELRVGNSAAVETAVIAGEVQLGFVETARRIVGLRSAVVGGDSLSVVVSANHPWARRRAGIPAELLADTPLLHRERGSGTRDAFEAALVRLGLEPAEPLAVLGSTTTLKSTCAAGAAPCVLSELAVAPDIANGTLVAVAVAGLDLRRQFRAVWNPAVVDEAVQRFIRMCRATSRR